MERILLQHFFASTLRVWSYTYCPGRLYFMLGTGTVPTLVVPLETTLAVDLPSKYRALTDTKV